MKALFSTCALLLVLGAGPARAANCQICHGKPDFSRPLGSGRVAVRCIFASCSRSNSWFKAAAPPEGEGEIADIFYSLME